MDRYTLDENNNVIKSNKIINMDLADRRVDSCRFSFNNVQYHISTVFLCLDHNFNNNGPPILFETMIFREPEYIDMYCERYATYDEAKEGHLEAINWLATTLGVQLQRNEDGSISVISLPEDKSFDEGF